MFDLDNWQEIWATISRNKLRSILTGFGVFWGIFMLVVLLALGNGLELDMRKSIDGFSANSVFFNSNETSEAYKGYRKGRSWNIKMHDLEVVRQKATAVEYISPMIFGGGTGKNVVRGRKAGSYGYRGVREDHFKVEEMNLLHGRTFNSLDMERERKVCIIGKEVYETLFEKGEDPLGQNIRLNGIYFQVVGVISPKSGMSIGGSVEESVFLPFVTMKKAFKYGDIVHFLACTAKPGFPASMVEEQVTAIIKECNSISPTDDKAMFTMNIEKHFIIFQMLFMGIGFIIWLVGGGALLSGIIGISNIMMVTVRERTREIGVKRALGAKPRVILIQILSESFVLTAIAGLLGFIVGVFVLEMIKYSMEMELMEMQEIVISSFVPFKKAIIALVVLVFSGILAGIMPAMRALKIKAIDAIREE